MNRFIYQDNIFRDRTLRRKHIIVPIEVIYADPNFWDTFVILNFEHMKLVVDNDYNYSYSDNTIHSLHSFV